jgi:hypothetical protein
MTRSLDAMRLWLFEESRDMAKIWHAHGASRERVRTEILYALGIEMKIDGYRIEDYQTYVDDIVDAVLAVEYGETHVEEDTQTH